MNNIDDNNISENQSKIYNAPSSLYIPVNSSGYYYTAPVLDPKLQLKKEIRSTVNKTSSGLLLFYGCGILYQIVITIIAMAYAQMGKESYNAFVSYISDPSFNLLMNSFYQALFMTLPFILSTFISKQRPSDILLYGKPKKGSVIPLAILGLGGAMLCNLANSIVYSLFSLFGSTPQGGNVEMNLGIESIFFNVFTIAVIPAVFEEFAFRGIFMGLLRKRLSSSAAIIISAAAFGLMHGNFSQMPFAFLIGLLLGYLYVASGSLWVPMLVHMLNNTYSVLLDHITNGMPTLTSNIVYFTSLVTLLLLGIVALCYIIKKRPEILDVPKEEETLIPTSGMLKIGFSSPVFIISALLYIIEAVAKQLEGVL